MRPKPFHKKPSTMLAFRNSVVYYRQRIRNVNFLDSEARELPMRHKNWWIGRFGRLGLECSRIGKQKLQCNFFVVVNKNLKYFVTRPQMGGTKTCYSTLLNIVLTGSAINRHN